MKEIEETELRLTMFNSKRALSAVEKDLRIQTIGSCTLLIDRNSPDSGYYNRIKGFSEENIVNLESILAMYEDHKINPFFELTPDNVNENVTKVLSRNGFSCVEQLVYMESGALKSIKAVYGFDMVKVSEKNAEGFIKIIELSNPGMEITEELLKKKKHFFHEPNFHNFIAYLNGKAAGIGSIFIDSKNGYIANDYTFEHARGKGCQKSLLAHRINTARNLGLQKLFTDVVYGSVSHCNMRKIGFTDAFISSFWAKQ